MTAAIARRGSCALCWWVRRVRRPGRRGRPGPTGVAGPTEGDGDLAVGGEELEHLGDVAVVRPTGRRPRQFSVVGRPRGQRALTWANWSSTRRRNPLLALSHWSALRSHPTGQAAMSGEVEAKVGHRTHHGDRRLGWHWVGAVLEHRAVVLECVLQVGGLGRRFPAGSRRRGPPGADRRGVELEEGVSRSTTVNKSSGRSASSSCARIAIRRASTRVRRRTSTGTGLVSGWLSGWRGSRGRGGSTVRRRGRRTRAGWQSAKRC